MTIFRYLLKEVLSATAAITTVLLGIFLSNQLVRYLARAAAGKLPGIFVLRLMMLEIPHLLGLLLPLGLFLGILVAYGRLYADNEMTVLSACGVGPSRLIKITLGIAAIVTLIVAFQSLWLGPKILANRDKLMQQGRSASIVETITPGRFRATSRGKEVFYVEDLARNRSTAHNVFVAQQSQVAARKKIDAWDVLSASKAYVEEDKKTDQRFVVLEDGYRYDGTPGQKDYKVTHFSKYALAIPEPKAEINKDVNALPTLALWPLDNKDHEKAAELQWRLSIPLSVLILALLAVPLSHLEPRQGKYAKILPAILIYIVYANLIFVSRDWVEDGVVSAKLGMWWLHAILIVFALALLLAPRLKKIRVGKYERVQHD